MVNTVRNLFSEAVSRIDRSDACVLLCDLLQCERAALLLKMDTPLSQQQSALMRRYINLAQEGMPIAYITGKKEFYSLTFEVGPEVLIPRPDTETLVDFAIKYAQGRRVLDICTGSGCIGISVAHCAPCEVTLLDVSKSALDIAARNARRNGVDARLLHCDILKDELCGEYDIVLSNPPYIESNVIKTLDKSVCEFEPHLALDGGENGLDFYPIIAKKAAGALSDDGILALEVGHTQARSVQDFVSRYFSETLILKDLSGISRVVVGKRPITYI